MIHATAIVDASAVIHESAEVGPYSYVGPRVTIGPHTRLMERVSITRDTTLGEGNLVYPGAVVGGDPQDFSFQLDHEVSCRIGDRNIIRESVTINRGTLKDKKETVIGNHNFFMACCHVGHDSIVEDHTTISNGVLLAGHVTVQTGAVISGFSGAVQFVTVGRLSYIAGMTGASQDVPPFVKYQGNDVRGLNTLGLKRAGFSHESLVQLREAYRVIWMSDLTLKEAILEIQSWQNRVPEVDELVSFLEAKSTGRFGRVRENTRSW